MKFATAFIPTNKLKVYMQCHNIAGGDSKIIHAAIYCLHGSVYKHNRLPTIIHIFNNPVIQSVLQ